MDKEEKRTPDTGEETPDMPGWFQGLLASRILQLNSNLKSQPLTSYGPLKCDCSLVHPLLLCKAPRTCVPLPLRTPHPTFPPTLTSVRRSHKSSGSLLLGHCTCSVAHSAFPPHYAPGLFLHLFQTFTHLSTSR